MAARRPRYADVQQHIGRSAGGTLANKALLRPVICPGCGESKKKLCALTVGLIADNARGRGINPFPLHPRSKPLFAAGSEVWCEGCGKKADRHLIHPNRQKVRRPTRARATPGLLLLLPLLPVLTSGCSFFSAAHSVRAMGRRGAALQRVHLRAGHLQGPADARRGSAVGGAAPGRLDADTGALLA